MERKKEFDLEHQYQLYLKRVALNEEGMHPQQKIQLRQTFMGACGQMLMLMKEELSELTEEQGVEALQDMTNQVLDYFQRENNRTN